MDWANLLSALALVMIIEGLVPFISPQGYKNTMQQMLSLPPATLRGIGLGLMVAGVISLYLVRNL